MSVKVAVRSRPLSANELKDDPNIIIRMNGNEVDVANSVGGTGRVFLYDKVLWSTGVAVVGSTNPEASQEMVYDAIGAEMLDHTLTGYNGCIFAYGQTGSGKTYSMMGPEDNPGIVPRLAENLFNESARLRHLNIEVCIEVSYYEIYCEKVRCLLRPSAVGFDDSALRVREHPKFGPFIEGLAKFVVGSQQEFLQLMNDGNKVRTTASTAMNATSSRSHAVFVITLTQKKKTGKFMTTTTSKLNLVDLAGSERASKTMATGQRFTEGTNINKSLTCLGNVISALAEVEETGKARHIPYRDAVLTWILKDNLGGNSKTVMLAVISPSAAQYEETMSTLRYAERAKKIMNKAVVNESNDNEAIAALQKEIANLKAQLSNASTAERARLQEELAASEAVQKELGTSLEEKLTETKRMMEERERYMRELEGKLAAQTNEIETLKRTNDEKEQKIADLLRRIEALAEVQAMAKPGSGGGAGVATDGAGCPDGSPTGTGQTMMDKMREEVAALEQEQNVAETQIKGRRRLAETASADENLSILMEANLPPRAGGHTATAATPMKDSGGGAASGDRLQESPPVYLTGQSAANVPVALLQGRRQALVAKAAGTSTSASSQRETDATDGLFDVDLDSLEEFTPTPAGGFTDRDSLGSLTGTNPADEATMPIDGDLQVDSDIDLSDSVADELEVDDDIMLDDEPHSASAQPVASRPPPPLGATSAATATAVAAATSHASQPSQGPWTAPTARPVASTPAQPPSQHEDPNCPVPAQGVAVKGEGMLVHLRSQMASPSPSRVEQPEPASTESRAVQQQQQQRAMESAAALQTWARSETRPEIFAPAQNVVELVVPSHALPNNHYLHEPFKVVKMKEAVIVGHRKGRIWDIDFFAHTFGNYDLNGTKSFALPSSHLFRVECDPCHPRRLTLYFFEAQHPYELEFVSASRRRWFYELAMLQRRSSILWCPSLCLDRENDVTITVRGTTIERPNRIVRVDGETKFTVARMPYEVIDFWYGCFSLEGAGGLPRSTAMLGSFIPKATHDLYIIGVADVPSSLIGNDNIGQYFVNYLGAADYYVVGTTTMDTLKRRSPYNAMVVICRRSFIVRISQVQMMEAPTVHKKGVSRSDFTSVACALHINEATVCAILVNAKKTNCSTQTRNACIRALVNGYPFGDASIDVASRFDYLLISGNFGFTGAGAPFTTADPLSQQIKLNNFMSNLQEAEPSSTLQMIREPMRVFFAVRPRVSRMDVGLYTTSRALSLQNAYVTADVFSQRTYLSVFGEVVPRTQLIFDHLQIVGDRLPDMANAQLLVKGDFFENSPLVATTIKQGPRHYSATATAIPILYPTVGNTEFLRLQTVHFALVGAIGSSSSSSSKASTLASGSLPLKNILALGESMDCAVPLYYHSCLVGVLQCNLLEIYYEKNYAEVAAAGLSRERFVSLVKCYENQVRYGGGWVPASAQPPFCDFSTKDPSVLQRRDGFELPDARAWRWLTEWQHDSRPDDAEGWIYSDGGNAPLGFKESRQSSIRRRRWMRAMQAHDAIAFHNYLSFKYEQQRANVKE